MSDMWIGLVVVGGTIAVLLGLALLAQRIRRRHGRARDRRGHGRL